MASTDYARDVVAFCPRCHEKDPRGPLANVRRLPARLTSDACGRVWLVRTCPDHGVVTTLYQESAEILTYLEEWQAPARGATPDDSANIAPVPSCYLRGLGGQQTQHTCSLLTDVTDGCNLRCPTCFVSAVPGAGSPAPVETILAAVDRRIEREGGSIDVVMVSGGEPTLHPALLRILQELSVRPIVRVLLNTNGLRLAHDDGLLSFLAEHNERIELYLQFDGFRESTWQHHRGADLRLEKAAIVRRAAEAEIFTTLVMCAARGVNDDEIGDVIRFALETPYVGGVCIQPQFGSGRSGRIDPLDRLTHTGVLARLGPQTDGLVTWHDLIGLPCSHPHCASVGYMLRDDEGRWRSLVSILGHEELKGRLDLVADRVANWRPRYTVHRLLRDSTMSLLSERNALSHPTTTRLLLNLALQSGLRAGTLARLWADVTPRGRRAARAWVGDRVTRITVKPFMDMNTMLEERLLRCCVHVAMLGETGPQAAPFCAAQAWPALGDLRLGGSIAGAERTASDHLGSMHSEVT